MSDKELLSAENIVAKIRQSIWIAIEVDNTMAAMPASIAIGAADLIESLQRRVAELEAAKEQEVRPVAWGRRVTSYIPGEPIEYDAEYSDGDDQPDGEGWYPLYLRPALTKEARHLLSCDMVKHPNCTRCSCGGIDSSQQSWDANGSPVAQPCLYRTGCQHQETCKAKAMCVPGGVANETGESP